LHGTTSEASAITLTNSGTTTASIYEITLGGTNPTDFAELSTCGSTLAAGASCSIYVSFKPLAVASYTASLILYDNAAGAPQTVALSGKGD
jgi:trimeric autotransporter adhesin